MTMPQIDLPVIYKDPALAVVNKPGGLLSVPGRGPDKIDSVETRLKALFPGCINQPAVHRLDMDTSGLILLAFNTEAHGRLSKQFQERLVEKQYIALLDGRIGPSGGEIRLAFRLDPENRPYQKYDPELGKLGITRWEKIGIEDGKTRVLFHPLTGRTHQLRLHAAHERGLGCPVIGDRLYGNGQPGDPMCLHASSLRFTHPDTGIVLQFESPPPF